MQRLVINEMRAYRKRFAALGTPARISAGKTKMPRGAWRIVASAYDPRSNSFKYLMVKEA